MRSACEERDRRAAYLQGELDLSRSAAASQIRGLAALGAELDALKVTARSQASRIRLEALREAAAVSGEARRLGSIDGKASEQLLAAVGRALDRLASDWEAGGRDAPDLEQELEQAIAPRNGSATAAAPDATAERPENRISVDIGPFRDFSQLLSFEDAAKAIDGAGEISIRRFSGGRANLDIDLDGPVDLLRELESRCDLEFEVRATEGEEIILDLGE